MLTYLQVVMTLLSLMLPHPFQTKRNDLLNEDLLQHQNEIHRFLKSQYIFIPNPWSYYYHAYSKGQVKLNNVI